jgi:hypothetical protein
MLSIFFTVQTTDIKLNKDGFNLVMSLYFSEDYPFSERK